MNGGRRRRVLCTACFNVFEVPETDAGEIDYDALPQWARARARRPLWQRLAQCLPTFIQQRLPLPDEEAIGTTRRLTCLDETCKRPLPPNAGAIETIVIGLIGGPSTGKTAYLTALIDALFDKAEMRGNGVRLQPEADSSVRMADLRRRMFANREMMPRTEQASEREPFLPFIYTMTIAQEGVAPRAYNVLFFDGSGEQIQRRQAMEQYCRYILHADGLICMLDPSKLEKVRKVVPDDVLGIGHEVPPQSLAPPVAVPVAAGRADSDPGDGPTNGTADGLFDPEDVIAASRSPVHRIEPVATHGAFNEPDLPLHEILANVAAMLRNHHQLPMAEPVDVPISVVVSKADVLRYMPVVAPLVDALSGPGEAPGSYSHARVLVEQEQVRKIVDAIAPIGLRVSGVSHFREPTYHVTSATGGTLRYNKRFGEVRPFRVVDPFGSILHRTNRIR
ncbi:MAG: hypothetical protein AB7N70_14010 [Dehalococcoidia bacterium]